MAADDKRSETASGSGAKRLEASLFQAGPNGAVPVRDWLESEIDAEDRRTIGNDIATVEFGWPVGMPTCRALGEGLCEVRSNISQRRIARLLSFIEGNRIVLLHRFIKKSAQTPNRI